MKKLLIEACRSLKIDIDDKQAEQFLLYKDLLKEWNEKINLTAITEDREIILKHFADCLTILTKRDLSGKAVIDVGTGAGFPGLPLKIAQSGIKLTLLDSLNKRINFLNEVCNKLSLEGVECVHSRAEDGGVNPLYREKFDVCVSRAVANLAVLCEYCLPFVKVGGEFIALKGPDAENELVAAKKAISLLGGEVVGIEEVQVPETDLSHNMVIIKKVSATPKKYPRKAGKISKNPL